MGLFPESMKHTIFGEVLKIKHTGPAIRTKKSRRNQLGMSSGPGALCTLIDLSLSSTEYGSVIKSSGKVPISDRPDKQLLSTGCKSYGILCLLQHKLDLHYTSGPVEVSEMSIAIDSVGTYNTV